MRLPSFVPRFILESMLARNSIWPSLERVSKEFSVAGVLDHETWVFDAVLAAHTLQVALPALAVGRIGEHEIELARGKRIVGQRGMLRPADQIVGSVAFTLEQEVGFGDGVGFGIDLLAVQMRGDLLVVFFGQLLQGFSATVNMPPVPHAPS